MQLFMLSGRWLYAHISFVRGDSIHPALLGMGRRINQDAVRTAPIRTDEGAGLAWLGGESARPAAQAPEMPRVPDINPRD